MRPRIVLCFPNEERHRRAIAEAAPWGEVVDVPQERIAQELSQADIFCGHAKVPVDWDAVVRAGRLQWIQSSAAGMDHCLVPSVIESDIVVTSASGVLADQVAEHTVALTTAWLRSLPTFFRAQQKHEFIRRPTRDLHRSTILIVGFGGVGRRLAQVLHVYKTHLWAVDLFPVDCPPFVEKLVAPADLESLLSHADITILALPLNDQTRGMFDARLFALMKPGSLFVNVARGPIVVTEDLMQALRAGPLAGAVMDVTDPEPLPPEHPLWDLPNVIITPHVGGQSATRADDITRLICENLRRWHDGRPLINLVQDKRLGFPIRNGSVPHWIDLCDQIQ